MNDLAIIARLLSTARIILAWRPPFGMIHSVTVQVDPPAVSVEIRKKACRCCISFGVDTSGEWDPDRLHEHLSGEAMRLESEVAATHFRLA